MNRSNPRIDHCTVCDSKAVYHRTIWANGGYGPRLLQGLGGWFRPAKMEVYLCSDCGHTALFADEESRKAVKERFAWKRAT